ncbi:transformer-2 protein homolog beta-like [Topomyia yanbarensis]|uniref:transformer-2 protein homolog beta-like n=1 Tax=Topomyia yanbarensis TaxID=2498891 RepID=UPI00273B29E7|nr:transformer-2 protein homolog beta-like [Topomyia yanbarensis]
MGRFRRDSTPNRHYDRRTERRRSRSTGKETSCDLLSESSTRNSYRPVVRTRGNCLGVFGISMNTTERDLHRIFSRYGEVERVSIVRHPKSGISRCFGFVYMLDQRDANRAKEQCDGMRFDERQLRVDFSKTDRPHSPTPGRYKGSPHKRERPLERFSRREKRHKSRSPTPRSRHHRSRHMRSRS